MKRLLWLLYVAMLPVAAIAVLSVPASAQTPHSKYDELIASHAQQNLVPEALVHRVIVRESKYQPGLVGRGGAIGLMQIKLATARGLGYSGTAEGLRDPETNLKYGIKYLAGAYRAAKGDLDRAVHYFAAGYYQVSKTQRLEHIKEAKTTIASAPPKALLNATADVEQTQTGTEQASNKQADSEPAKTGESTAAPQDGDNAADAR